MTFDLLTPISEDRRTPPNNEEQARVPEAYRALASDTSDIVIHPLFDGEGVLELRLATSKLKQQQCGCSAAAVVK